MVGGTERERGRGWKEGKQDEKLISRRLKPTAPAGAAPPRSPWHKVGAPKTRSHKSGLWEWLLLAMLPECTETTHLFDRK